ncbi:MAG: cyclase family protein [Selenomonadaceae bacterium]|nr:cyclase family protein [Selenomonadaceae bacterium]
MKIDLTYVLTNGKIAKMRGGNYKGLVSLGHMGTHFDVMDKIFSLDYSELRGVAFDVSHISDRDVEISDIDAEKVRADDFVLFYTGTIERYEYASDDYSKNFPQISWGLIKNLVERKVKIIGVDTRGLRKGGEHPKADQFCADNNVFVVENLVNLGKICGAENLTIHTYPMNIRGFTGIPTRVVAEIQEAV